MSQSVLVTGTGGGGVGAGILQVLLATERAYAPRTYPSARDTWLEICHWEPVAVDSDPFAWGLYAARERAVVSRADMPGYLDELRYLIEKHRIAAIIPGTQAETVLLACHRDEIPVPVIANDARLMAVMEDKAATARMLRELELPAIPTYPWAQRMQAVREHGPPLVVKPAKSTSGSRDVHVVHDGIELARLAVCGFDCEMIVQPYVGSGDQEYTVAVLSHRDGTIIDSIVTHRRLTGLGLGTDGPAPISSGISQGTIIRHRELQDFGENLARRLGSTGPLAVQIRIKDGQFYVYDLHVRFTGSVAIRASVGFNEPDVLLRHWLHGERFGRLDYRADVAAIRTFDHLLVPVEDLLNPDERPKR